MKFINLAVTTLIVTYLALCIGVLRLSRTLHPSGADRGPEEEAEWAGPPMDKNRLRVRRVGRDDDGRHRPPGGLMISSSSAAADVGIGSLGVPRSIPGRFPDYGTAEFHRECNWTLTPRTRTHTNTASHPQQREKPDDEEEGCTFLVRPRPNENEGIALWVSQIVMAHLFALQADCRLMIDYGPGIDIGIVLTPPAVAADLPNDNDGHRDGDNGGYGDDHYQGLLHNWTVPHGLNCTSDPRCHPWPRFRSATTSNVSFPEELLPAIDGRRRRQQQQQQQQQPPLASVPFYRFALWNRAGNKAIYEGMFRVLEGELPGFRVETGMACSLGSLFRLAPTVASEFEPGLFSDILPKVRDEKVLVLAVYVRASQAELAANATEDTQHHIKVAKELISGALSVEERYLTGAIKHERDVRRIVWLVITDSPFLKRWTAETYGGVDANARVRPDGRKLFPSRVIRREVLFTGSRGAHTRTRQDPSTADFAEAFLDWYLIGESDAVIAGAYTFGLTASLRTARPVYDQRGVRLKLVRSGERPRAAAGGAIAGGVLAKKKKVGGAAMR